MAHPTDDRSHGNKLRTTGSVDDGGFAKIGLEVGDHIGIHLEIAGFFIGEEADIAGLILAVRKFHFTRQGDGCVEGMAGPGEKRASGFHGKGPHPAGEARAAVSRIDPKMRKVDGTGGAFGRSVNNGGIVTNGGDLIFWIEGEDHGVMKKWFPCGGLRAVPLKTVFKDGAGFHFSARPEKFG